MVAGDTAREEIERFGIASNAIESTIKCRSEAVGIFSKPSKITGASTTVV